MEVRPRATVDGNSPVERSRKAERINMSVKHRFGTDYELAAVMLGYRGSESRGQAGTMNGRSQLAPTESPKKAPEHRTPFGGAVGQ
jgi:hypothetical protein